MDGIRTPDRQRPVRRDDLGGVKDDHIQFNEKTLWTGSTKIHGTYQNFGDLFIEDISDVFGTTADKAVSNYVRTLDMTKGIATAEYTSPAILTESWRLD